tara:strand:+ start:870 stop:1517 length:648 start_codon:yes stop_codon:yes gene_type:complete
MTYLLQPKELAYMAVNAFGALQKPEEFYQLLELLAKHDKISNILEVGVGNGGTSWALSKLNHLRNLIAIDLPDGGWGGKAAEATGQSFGYIKNNSLADVHLILGNSQNAECPAKVKELLGDEMLDFLFIDGDHSYAGVKTDFLTYSPLVRKGGLIAFHDICIHAPETGCEVHKFWQEIIGGILAEQTQKNEDQFHRLHKFTTEPTNWGGIGVIEW